MKLHVKLLSFAALLASLMTSCVNEGLQEPQDAEILKMIPALEEQAAAVEASVNDIQNLQTELAADDAELSSAVVAALEQHVADLKKGGMSLEEGTFAAFELQKQLGAAVGSALAELDADNKLMRSFNALEKGVKAWVGENFDALYPAAVADARVKASVAKFDSKLGNQKLYVDALLSDVEAGLRNDENPEELKTLAASVYEASATSQKLGDDFAGLVAEVENEYETAVKSVLTDAAEFDAEALKEFNANARVELASVGTSLSDLITRVELCESQLNTILARLGALEGVVGDLEELLGMIQSVTLMTEYSAEEAVAYYNMGHNTTSEGYKERTPVESIELNYIVRPASAASALTAQSLWNNGLKVFGYYANRIQQSAVGNLQNFTIKNVTANSTTGVVTVTVNNSLSDDFYYKKTGAKMALSVTTGKTDITSKFVEVVPKDASGTVYLESLTLSKDEVEFDEGDELNLVANISPSNATNKELVWTSANNDVVSVSGSGRITGVGVGTATVTVTSKGTDEWGRTLSATCSVKVNPAIKLSGPLYVEVDKTAELTLDFPSSMLIESKVWWTSDDTKATVSNDGVITGLAHTYNEYKYDYGTVTVYCKVNESVTLSHEIKVVVPQPRNIKFNNYADDVRQVTMKVDESISLAGTVLPEVSAGYFRMFYESNAGLGWIDSSTGVVNAGRNTTPGAVYVYARVFEIDKNHYFAPGRSLSREILVNVEPYYVQTITMDDLDLEPGQTVTLVPKFTTDIAGKQPTNTTLTWVSNNPSVATVDQNGKVTSVTSGTAIITATATDGSNVSGSCKVTVTEAWKDFNVGDIVVRTSSGDIEFCSDKSTAQSKGTIVGVVITKTNPRVTDSKLPASCTHGIAIALGEGSGNWWSDSYHDSATRVSAWAEANGHTFVSDVDKYAGYTNTLALKAYVSAHSGLSSGISDAYTSYNSNGPQLPNGTSSYYLPSAQAMNDVAKLSNMSWNFANKILNLGGVKFANDYYWTVSEVGQTNASAVNPLTGESTNSQKTSTKSVRYVFAF